MKRSKKNVFHPMILCMIIFGFSIFQLPVLAEGPKPDVQVYLPLFERNSLGQKVLDITYSESFESKFQGKHSELTEKDVHLVFDAGKQNYRQEEKFYKIKANTDEYDFFLRIWDGEKSVTLQRGVSKKLGLRTLGPGVYEHPGLAKIQCETLMKIPFYLMFLYDANYRPYAETIPSKNPKLGSITEDTITIETGWRTFVFDKKIGALKQLEEYAPNRQKKKTLRNTYELSNHVECSGIWIPLRIVETITIPDEDFWFKREFSVESKTLRLLDEMDVSLLNESLPLGCRVQDEVRKESYQITTVDTLPNDVEAVKKTLEKMLEQAQEQKTTVEQTK